MGSSTLVKQDLMGDYFELWMNTHMVLWWVFTAGTRRMCRETQNKHHRNEVTRQLVKQRSYRGVFNHGTLAERNMLQDLNFSCDF